MSGVSPTGGSDPSQGINLMNTASGGIGGMLMGLVGQLLGGLGGSGSSDAKE